MWEWLFHTAYWRVCHQVIRQGGRTAAARHQYLGLNQNRSGGWATEWHCDIQWHIWAMQSWHPYVTLPWILYVSMSNGTRAGFLPQFATSFDDLVMESSLFTTVYFNWSVTQKCSVTKLTGITCIYWNWWACLLLWKGLLNTCVYSNSIFPLFYVWELFGNVSVG